MIHKSGTTILAKVNDSHDMDEFIESLHIKSDSVIIKPNWVDGLDCSHTDMKVLDMFLSSLGKNVYFVESYTFWRTDKMCKQGVKEDYFSSEEATLENGRKHWNFFKKQDKWFLKKEGFDSLMEKHNARYINVTNAVWQKDTAPKEDVKKIVERDLTPVVHEEFYSYVPKEISDLKGADFISFAKAKLDTGYGLSLSIKNMFGMIPDPTRAPKYHKDEDKYLADAIIDMHKIYGSLFNMNFVVDGVFTACEMDFDTNTTVPYRNWGVIIGGKNALEVDRVGSELMRGEFKGAMIELNEKYASNFGETDVKGTEDIPKEFYLRRK
ncbi:DUF362 domain-containing protein [Candidatus Dojkabacteria bacterium]|nr:DUF362 domain-containing protein [Candidatus Dojkabacteria bacterium]